MTILASAIVAAINLVSLALDPRDRAYGLLAGFDIGHGLLAAAVAIWLVRTRTRISLRGCELAFVIVTAPFLVGIWLPQMYDLREGALLEPLLAHHFLLLGIAVVAPTLRIGVTMVVVFTLHGLALWQALAAKASSPAFEREPWFTLFFGVVSVMLLYTSARRRDLEQRLAVAEARTVALAQVSRVLLALRDRANTPLQTLEVALTLLEAEAPTEHLPLMRRALSRLITIQRTLATSDLRRNDLEAPLDLEEALRELVGEPETKTPDRTTR